MKRIAISICLVMAAAYAIAADSPVIDRRPASMPKEVAQRLAPLMTGVQIDAITYKSDALPIRGFIATPKGAGPFPCIIFNHGGNSNDGEFQQDVGPFDAITQYASWGYIVIASRYRGQAGSGAGHDDYGGADIDDVIDLLPIIDSLPNADHTRIGMVGASRGSMTTYLALLRTDRISAAVNISGMSDLFESGHARPEMEANFKRFMPDYAANRDAALGRRSAVRWADKLPANVPILLLHGTADWRVSVSQSIDMARALLAAKHPVRLEIFEGGSHGLPEFSKERDAATREFLDAYVRDRKKWPDLTPHGK